MEYLAASILDWIASISGTFIIGGLFLISPLLLSTEQLSSRKVIGTFLYGGMVGTLGAAIFTFIYPDKKDEKLLVAGAVALMSLIGPERVARIFERVIMYKLNIKEDRKDGNNPEDTKQN